MVSVCYDGVAVWRCGGVEDLAATGSSRPGDEVRRCEKGAGWSRDTGGDRAGHCQALLSSYQSDRVLIAEITTEFLSDSIRLNRD